MTQAEEEKAMVPELRFSEFKEEWSESRLENLAATGFSNGVFNDPKKAGTGYKFVNVKDMYDGDNINLENLTLLELSDSEFEKNKVAYGDIFFTRSSLVKEGIAWSNVMLSHVSDVAYDGHLIKMSLDLEEIDPYFFSKVLKTQTLRRQIVARGKTGTMTTIGQEDMASVKASIPKLDEQQKIASFLTAVDEKLNQLRRKRDCLQVYKRGVMQKIFSQEIRFTRDDRTAFPDWKAMELGQITNVIMGTSPSSSAYNNESEGLPLIQGNADIQDSVSSPRSYTSEITKECFPEDILLSVRAPVGEVSLSKHHACIGRGMAAIKAKQKNLQPFIYQYLLYFELRWGRISQGSTFESVNTKDILGLKLLVPVVEEQRKVADFLSSIDEKIDAVNKKITEMETFKKGLLQKMFV